MKRTLNAGEGEPDQKQFDIPSAKEHLFQVVDVFDNSYEGNKFNLDENTVLAKLEVVGGDEEGRTMLQRMSLDDKWKGFFATKMFLKAIGENYKGSISIDTELWIGKQFYATIVHNDYKGKTYANIDNFNFEKKIEQSLSPAVQSSTINPEDIQWEA